MTFVSFLLSLAGMPACFALGMMFSNMESFVLSLNRFRLLQFFADEHPEDMTEQQIFRETKDLYFISRLGMCVSVAGAGICLFRILLYLLGKTLGIQRCGLDTLLVLSAGLTLLLLTPPLMAALGFPRFFSRHISIESESDLPRLMQWFLALTRRCSFITSFCSNSFMARLLPGRELSKGELVTLATDLDVDEEEETEEEPEEESEEAEPGDDADEEWEEEEDESEETDEEEIIYNILDLDDTMVREVMRPINTVVAVRLGSATAANVRDLARRTGYSRFPVYREGIVDLTGYVSIYDILNDSDDSSRSLETYVQPAYYVPEFMCVRALLWEFRNRNLDAAVVVDEHGGSSGWVTREDVLEEIVGAVEDEFDDWRGQFEKCEDGSYLVDGALHIDDVADQLDLEFDDPEYDTLAGYLLMTLGHIPTAGERLESETALYVVERMERNRIAQVRITLKKSDVGDSVSED